MKLERFVKFTFILLFLSLSSSCVVNNDTSSDLEFDDLDSGPVVIQGGGSFKAFKETVYPIVRSNTCVKCHGASQSPKFALEDAEQAWYNLTTSNKVDLSDPASSRIVLKLAEQSHNCWSDCEENSNEMLNAVKEWASLVGDVEQDIGKFTTQKLPYPDSSHIAQTEYGRVILQAEQESSEVLFGRYEIFSDSEALGQKYMTGPKASENPLTDADRSIQISNTGCVVPSDEDIAKDKNGAVRIMEERTFIPSGTRTISSTNASDGDLIVKDGYTPYGYELMHYYVRPDKRIEFAKKLLSKDVELTSVGEFLINDGVINREGAYVAGNIPTTVDGEPVSGSLGEVLPHFINFDEMYSSYDNLRGPNDLFTTDDGSQKKLYELFKEGAYEPTNSTILNVLHRDDKSDYKKQVLYPLLKRNVYDWLNTSNRERYAYSRISSLVTESFFVTDHIVIALDCYNWYEGHETELRNPNAAVGSRDYGIYKNCDPNYTQGGNPYPGRVDFITWEVLDSNNFESKVKLTQSNALDKLTLNSAQTAIVSASASDIASGNWFHRMDLYYLPYISSVNKVNPNSILHLYKTSTSSSTFVENEQFNPDTNFDERSSSEVSGNDNLGGVRYALPSRSFRYELNLSGLFNGSTEEIDSSVNLQNFKDTLYDVVTTNRCFDCHNSGNQVRFAQENPVLALKVIEDNGLVNFKDPLDSFRGRDGGFLHQCDNSRGEDRYDCSKDAELKESFINAINSWNNLNKSSLTEETGIYSLTTKERTPGRARYKFQVNSAGFYNVWFRIKSDTGGNNKSINYRIVDENGYVKTSYRNSNGTAQANASFCEEFSVNNTTWKWNTFGRTGELEILDSRGERLLDDDQNPLTLPSNRKYWNLSTGIYFLEVFEEDVGVQLDLVALNKVDDFTQEGRLNFQPDLRTGDERYISNYDRNLLKYDLSHLLDLERGESAFFEIEVRRDYNNQNYIFRAPRFTLNSSDSRRKLYVKSIRGLINGKHAFTDATYSIVDYILGKGRVVTYAPLVTLVPDPNDYLYDKFSFAFEELKIETSRPYSELNPAGETATISDARGCMELDLFVNTVKPILKNVTVALTGSYNSFISGFPGTPGQQRTSIEGYKCMTCHNENHPYFKMTTFDFNDDLLCSQALSRVDFDNFYQSTIVRGINGSNNHPAFYFLEEFEMNSSESQWENHDLSDDYLSAFTKSATSDYKTKYIRGPVSIYEPSDFGLNDSMSFNSLSAANQEKAKLIGSFKKIQFQMLPTDESEIGGYREGDHALLLGTIRSERDIVDPSYIPDLESSEDAYRLYPLRLDRENGSAGRAMYYHPSSSQYNSNPSAFSIDRNNNGTTSFDGVVPLYQKSADNVRTLTLDWRGDLSGINSKSEFINEVERVRTKYREAIINWIRAEDEAYKASN